MDPPSLEAGQKRKSAHKKGSVLRRLAGVFKLFREHRPHSPRHLKTTSGGSPYQGFTARLESEEDARTKFWSIYVSEAERYDAALVESWRADMEGMLIFSGLFSASLTAFLIESYKTLQPDSGDLTVAAISQVSQQLAAISNGQSFTIPPAQSFTPGLVPILCNALWFISLTLSLTSALLATLVEQWAREFMHRTELRRSPIHRARIFSFLYFGLKRFRMHTVVDAIPLLLHASLLLFFAGLVVFLIPVNRLMMHLIVILLAIFLGLYALLTIIPAIALDSPYRTPLSQSFWSAIQPIFSVFADKSLSGQPMTEAIVNRALHHTEDRDQRAIQWTLNSLTNDLELLPFVEAIPSVIHGHHGFRLGNDLIFSRVLGNDLETGTLVARINNLLAGTSPMDHGDPLRLRRTTAGLRALWALSLIPESMNRRFDFTTYIYDVDDHAYKAAAILAMEYHATMWYRHLFSTIRDLLDAWDSASEYAVHALKPQIQPYLSMLKNYDIVPIMQRFKSGEYAADFAVYTVIPTSRAALEASRIWINNILDSPEWNLEIARIGAGFIHEATRHAQDRGRSLELLHSCKLVLASISGVARGVRRPLRTPITLEHLMIPSLLSQESLDPPVCDRFAQAAFRLMPFLLPQDFTSHLFYLVNRRSASALRYALEKFHRSELARLLHDYLRVQHEFPRPSLFAQGLQAIIIVANTFPDYESTAAVTLIDDVMENQPFSPPPELIAVRYVRYLDKLSHELQDLIWDQDKDAAHIRIQAVCHDDIFHPRSPLFLPTNVDIRTVKHSLETEICHLYLLFLANFLENCVSPSWVDVRVFELAHSFLSDIWSTTDPQTQMLFFHAVLKFTRHLHDISLYTDPNDGLQPALLKIAEQVWSSHLFWTHVIIEDEPRTVPSRLDEVEPSYLRCLVESLELYHKATTTVAGEEPLEDAASRRILREVVSVLETA